MIDRAKLAEMTRTEKIEWLKLVEERERRLRLRKDVYQPNPGQAPVHLSDKKTRMVISGNGAGKTTLGVQEAMWAADGYNPITDTFIPVPRRVIVVLDQPAKVEDKWLPEIRKWFKIEEKELKKNGKPYYNQIIRPSGSQIKFMFHEQEDLAFESLEVDDIIFDEPPPRRVYIALIRGMRNLHKKARILFIGTPITGSWMRRDIYDPWTRGELPDTDCFKFSSRVNDANVPEGFVDWFSSKLSEKERLIRIEGHFFDLDGLALAHLFSRDTHILSRETYKFKEEWPVVVSIDPHPSKPHVATLVGADPYGPVVLKELSAKLTPRRFAKELKKWYEGYRIIDIVVDDWGSSETTGGEDFKSFIEILQEEGIRARPTRWADKHDEDWISRLQDALQVPDEPDNTGQQIPSLRFMEGCTGIVNDVETVEWDKYRNIDEFKPTLAIGAKDYLATLKYALATNLHIGKRKEKVFYRNKPAYGVVPKHSKTAKRQGHMRLAIAKRKYGL